MSSVRKTHHFTETRAALEAQYSELAQQVREGEYVDDSIDLVQALEMVVEMDHLVYQYHALRSYLDQLKTTLNPNEASLLWDMEKLVQKLEHQMPMGEIIAAVPPLQVLRREYRENAREGGKIAHRVETSKADLTSGAVLRVGAAARGDDREEEAGDSRDSRSSSVDDGTDSRSSPRESTDQEVQILEEDSDFIVDSSESEPLLEKSTPEPTRLPADTLATLTAPNGLEDVRHGSTHHGETKAPPVPRRVIPVDAVIAAVDNKRAAYMPGLARKKQKVVLKQSHISFRSASPQTPNKTPVTPVAVTPVPATHKATPAAVPQTHKANPVGVPQTHKANPVAVPAQTHKAPVSTPAPAPTPQQSASQTKPGPVATPSQPHQQVPASSQDFDDNKDFHIKPLMTWSARHVDVLFSAFTSPKSGSTADIIAAFKDELLVRITPEQATYFTSHYGFSDTEFLRHNRIFDSACTPANLTYDAKRLEVLVQTALKTQGVHRSLEFIRLGIVFRRVLLRLYGTVKEPVNNFLSHVVKYYVRNFGDKAQDMIRRNFAMEDSSINMAYIASPYRNNNNLTGKSPRPVLTSPVTSSPSSRPPLGPARPWSFHAPSAPLAKPNSLPHFHKTLPTTTSSPVPATLDYWNAQTDHALYQAQLSVGNVSNRPLVISYFIRLKTGILVPIEEIEKRIKQLPPVTPVAPTGASPASPAMLASAAARSTQTPPTPIRFVHMSPTPNQLASAPASAPPQASPPSQAPAPPQASTPNPPHRPPMGPQILMEGLANDQKLSSIIYLVQIHEMPDNHYRMKFDNMPRLSFWTFDITKVIISTVEYLSVPHPELSNLDRQVGQKNLLQIIRIRLGRELQKSVTVGTIRLRINNMMAFDVFTPRAYQFLDSIL